MSELNKTALNFTTSPANKVSNRATCMWKKNGGMRGEQTEVEITRGNNEHFYQHSHLLGQSGGEMAIVSVKYPVKCCYLR